MEKKPKADIIVGFCFIFAAVAFLIPSFQLGISGPEAIPGPGAGFSLLFAQSSPFFWELG